MLLCLNIFLGTSRYPFCFVPFHGKEFTNKGERTPLLSRFRFLCDIPLKRTIAWKFSLFLYCLCILGYYIEFCFSFIKICLNSNSDRNTSSFFRCKVHIILFFSPFCLGFAFCAWLWYLSIQGNVYLEALLINIDGTSCLFALLFSNKSRVMLKLWTA